KAFVDEQRIHRHTAGLCLDSVSEPERQSEGSHEGFTARERRGVPNRVVEVVDHLKVQSGIPASTLANSVFEFVASAGHSSQAFGSVGGDLFQPAGQHK